MLRGRPAGGEYSQTESATEAKGAQHRPRPLRKQRAWHLNPPQTGRLIMNRCSYHDDDQLCPACAMAPSPMTHDQKAAIWGATAIDEPDAEPIPAPTDPTPAEVEPGTDPDEVIVSMTVRVVARRDTWSLEYGYLPDQAAAAILRDIPDMVRSAIASHGLRYMLDDVLVTDFGGDELEEFVRDSDAYQRDAQAAHDASLPLRSVCA